MKDINIPAGYKSTDIGVIPEDWEVELLGNVCQTSSGTTPSRQLNDRYYKKGSIYWIKTTDLNNSIILDSEEQITELALKETCLKINPPQTVLIAMYGGFNQIGRTGILKIPATVNQALIAIQPIKKILDSFYLINYLNYSVDYWKIVAVSSRKDPNITSRDVKRFPLSLPPLPEQKAIARVLSDVDELIRECDSLLAKKRDIKQGTMQQLLTGKQRLPGFSGEWEEKILEEVADNKIKWSISGGPFGSNLKSSDYTTDGVRIIQLQNIGDGIFYDDYKIYTSEKKANELISCNIYSGEIILSKMGDPVARSCFIPGLNKRYLMCSDGIRLVVDKNHFDKKFIHDYINSKYFRNKAIDSSTGSTRMRIGLQDLKKLTLITPTLPEQKAIAKILSDMDAEIEALEKKRDKYKAIKQGMMQELLTGRIRLVDS